MLAVDDQSFVSTKFDRFIRLFTITPIAGRKSHDAAGLFTKPGRLRPVIKIG